VVDDRAASPRLERMVQRTAEHEVDRPSGGGQRDDGEMGTAGHQPDRRTAELHCASALSDSVVSTDANAA
jgi:hypothetical protein